MKITMKVFAALSLLVFATNVVAAPPVRMLKTWNDRYPGSTVICDRYAELLEKASGGTISVQISGPETIPPTQQIEPTRNGLFQVLCTYPGFHTGSTKLLIGLESIRPNAQAFRNSGAMEVIQEVYGRLGLRVLSVPLAHGGWVFMNRDLSPQGDLSGLQIRALPTEHAFIKAIGGTPVMLPPGEMFSALERGVVDGALFPAAGAAGYGFPEVTNRYFDAGVTLPHLILVNPAFWEGLPDNQKRIFTEQAKVLEDEIPGIYDRLNQREHQRMTTHDMKRLDLSKDVASRLADSVLRGSWDVAASSDQEAAETLRQRVEKAGLLRD